MIKVTDIAYGRIRSPNLEAQEEFLTDFGMVRAERTRTALYMRGTDPEHHIHVTELGEPGFISLAFNVESEEELDKASRIDGASPIEEMDEPGGGKRVRLAEPNGYTIEIVHGIETLPPIPIPRFALNTGAQGLARKGELTRIDRGPSHVKRIGHAVMMTPDLRHSVAWVRGTLGLVGSDDVYAGGDENNIILSFNRVDRGKEYVDHHVFLYVHGKKAGLNHMAFEVHDIDDVFMGHEHLRRMNRYEHVWGLGRHVLGSQVFDYWMDPWDRVHEHWTDSDRLNSDTPSNLVAVEEGLDSQWGAPAPEKFIRHATE